MSGNTVFVFILLFFAKLEARDTKLEVVGRTQAKGSSSQNFLRRDGNDRDVIDSCDDDDRNLLNENHVAGDCRTFNEEPCLCELNPNCAYQVETEECQPLADCNMYSDSPAGCRAAHCYYDCSSKRCIPKRETPEGCEGLCSQYCFDVCSCHAKGCQSTAGGSCQEFKQPECPNTVFPAPYCARNLVHYLNPGGICKNFIMKGNCAFEKTVAAVNFGGTAAVDRHGILHMAERDFPPSDPHNLRLMYTVEAGDQVQGSNAALYKEVVYGDPTKRASGRCIEYAIPITENGVYELAVKTMEGSDVTAGEKLFNIKFGNKYIFAEVDVVKLAGARYKPVELNANFKVKNQMLTIDGVTEFVIQNGVVPLGFCFSECSTVQSSFQVAGFSVSKFMSSDTTPPPINCEVFNGDMWTCLNSFLCEYDSTTETCKPPRTGPPPEVINMDCSNEAVDVLFLLDSTSSTPDQPSGKSSLVFDEFPRISNIAESLKKKYKNARFGIAFFSDFACYEFSEETCDEVIPDGVRNHEESNGCYRRHMPLTEDLAVLKHRSQRTVLNILYSHSGEPGLFSAMLALQDCSMNWTQGAVPVVKIIILITDDILMTRAPTGLITKVDAKFDGTDTCWGTIHPNNDQLKAFFQEKKVSFFFLVNKDQVATSYTNALDPKEVPSTVALIGSETTEIETKLEKLVLQQLNRNAGCLNDTKPLCPTPKVEILYLLDGSSNYVSNQGSDASTKSLVFDNFPRIVTVSDAIRRQNPESRFGIALFSGFSCLEIYGNRRSCRSNDGVFQHVICEACYTPHQKLTTNLTLLYEQAQRDLLNISISWSGAPGYFAAFLAVQNFDTNWTPGNTPDVVKMVVLITDDIVTHAVANFYGNKTAPKFDGTDGCCKTLQPSVEEYNSYFAREGISFFFLTEKMSELTSYQQELVQTKVPSDSALMGATNDEIQMKMSAFVNQQVVRKRKEMLEEGKCGAPPCQPLPVDVLYLLDSTGSLPATSGTGSLVLDAFPRIVGTAATIQTKFPQAQFAIGLFNEFPCGKVYDETCKESFDGVLRHDNCDFCMRRHQSLTSNLTLLNERAQRDTLTIWIGLDDEPGLFGAALAAQDTGFNWRRGSEPSVKLIVLITDAPCHLRGGKGSPPKFDGTDRCCGTIQGTKLSYSQFFAQEKISFLFVVEKRSNADSYQGYLDADMVDSQREFIASSNNKIAEKMEELINKAINNTQTC